MILKRMDDLENPEVEDPELVAELARIEAGTDGGGEEVRLGRKFWSSEPHRFNDTNADFLQKKAEIVVAEKKGPVIGSNGRAKVHRKGRRQAEEGRWVDRPPPSLPAPETVAKVSILISMHCFNRLANRSLHHPIAAPSRRMHQRKFTTERERYE